MAEWLFSRLEAEDEEMLEQTNNDAKEANIDESGCLVLVSAADKFDGSGAGVVDLTLDWEE